MSKAVKNKIILTIIGIFLVLILAVSLYFGVLQSGVSGFSTLSLGQPTFTSSDPKISGQAWLLTVSQNGAGQTAFGKFTATDDSATSDPFDITLSLTKNYATYKIQNQGTFVQHVDYERKIYNPLSSTGGCDKNVYQYWYKPKISAYVYCYKFTNSAAYGTVSNANINFESTITVKGTGGTESCLVSNTGTSSCSSNDGKMIASWVGSLVSGVSAPQPADQNIIALYKTSSSGWIIADSESYNNWKTQSSINTINACLEGYKGTACFTELNDLEATALSGKTFTSSGGRTATTSGSQSNGQITLILPYQIQFPVITMRIKADIIGINIPVGDPKITQASSDCFQTGSSGIIKVTVKNIGDGEGSFDVSANCKSGFSQTGNALRISSLGIDKSETVYIPISGNNVDSNALTSSCTITATDVNNPANTDSTSANVCVKSIVLCEQGQRRVSGSAIEECQNNIWKIVEVCSTTQEPRYVDSVPKCVDKNSNIGSSSTCSKWLGLFTSPTCLLKQFFEKFRLIFSIILGFISFIAAWIFYKMIDDKADLGNKWYIGLGVGVVLGILGGILAYISFYIVLIILVIGIIVKLLINRFLP